MSISALRIPQLRGHMNPLWKGEDAAYSTKHIYIYRHQQKPKCCNNCGLEKPLDLANISGAYKRDMSDWEWLCRRCHMNKDGRINNLNRGKMPKTYCECGQPSVVHNSVCMKHYNCRRRHAQPCKKCQ